MYLEHTSQSIQLAYKKGSFLHPIVIQINRQLDEYIVILQKLRR
ncbi:Spo0E family sporulation regulatory protein-aspartic acid phosphatase [Brevibacillus halotolerans]|nr:Spo0E family sporulation regulatory protein-aspartic acid phosphatase [Brevibacillus halotolerans]